MGLSHAIPALSDSDLIIPDGQHQFFTVVGIVFAEQFCTEQHWVVGVLSQARGLDLRADAAVSFLLCLLESLIQPRVRVNLLTQHIFGIPRSVIARTRTLGCLWSYHYCS